ncbi:MAG: hypothetical protein ACE141_04710 [Bryobacteraceae bacterium]
MRYMCALAALAAIPLMAADGRVNKVATTEWDNVLPQVVDGGPGGQGWSTRIMLVNMGGKAGEFTLYFYKEDGTPWPLELKNEGVVTSVTKAIPTGGAVFLETTGKAETTSQGWAYMSTVNWISGMAVFKAAWMPTNDAEAVVPFAGEADSTFYIPFDNRNGYVTSVALVNPYPKTTANVAVQFRNPDGTIIKDDTITLLPGQHLAFETSNRYPETAGKNGVVQFYVDPATQVAVSGLGLLFSPRNTFTSIHPVAIDPYLF